MNETTTSEQGHLGPESLLWEMYQYDRPVQLGGMAGMLTMLLYPPVCHAQVIDWKRSGVPVNPNKRTIPGWLTPIYGDAAQVERLRMRAAARHGALKAELPPEVDAERFGTRYQADEPAHMVTMYVALLRLMLAAQEALYRRLSEAERDRYCREAAGSIGYAYGIEDRVPQTGEALRDEYEQILAERLQATAMSREALGAMLDSSHARGPARQYVLDAAWLLDPRVADALEMPAPGVTERHRMAVEAMERVAAMAVS